MVAWLELLKLDGLALLNELLDDLPHQKDIQPLLLNDVNKQGGRTTFSGVLRDIPHLHSIDPPKMGRTHKQVCLDAQQANALIVGPLALELAYAQAMTACAGTLALLNCVQPLWLLGYFPQIARRGMCVAAQWHQQDTMFTRYYAHMDAHGVYPLIQLDPTKGSDAQTAKVTLRVAPQLSSLSLKPQGNTTAIQPEKFRQRALAHWEEGIEVEEQIWQRLTILAKEVLVEATDASRQRGAGEEAD